MIICRSIRVQGIVQGVGFRPAVWRFAKRLGLKGEVFNDGNGVLIHVWGKAGALDKLTELIRNEPPPLARIDEILVEKLATDIMPMDFSITISEASSPHTNITPDAASCTSCIADIVSPGNRRYKYPFTNCTHCGPRFSIINAIPYDRKNTSMASFRMCENCFTEYNSTHDRRFHAQPNACQVCGPKVWLEFSGARNVVQSGSINDQYHAIEQACERIRQGDIIAIKGIGGFHLACDSNNAAAVKRLRQRKRRYQKPFALMAKDISDIKDYCIVDCREAGLLQSREAPIVILQANGKKQLPDYLAPGQCTLGFMLPYSPLHYLLMQQLDRPIVLTSGNAVGEPQCIDNDDARVRLGDIADFLLLHDREILSRIDDSVARVMGAGMVLLRRARGYVPAPLPLPPGFDSAPEILAMGGELKNTFCLLKDNKAIVSQHIGDLEDAPTYQCYVKNLRLFKDIYEHIPEKIVIDKHPEYMASKLGRQAAAETHTPIDEVQHHHAHIAACMAENTWPLDAGPVLGIALDGLGFGEDGTFWGGEFLLVNYADYERVGSFRPVALPGGIQAMREPWRNTYAQLGIDNNWPVFEQKYAQLEIIQLLQSKPLDTLHAMLRSRTNSPLASSCGRLFDAVAAAVGVCSEITSYEGQAAIELEALIDRQTFESEDESLAYSFAIKQSDSYQVPFIDSATMWQQLLDDLQARKPVGIISARFHKGLAKIINEMALNITQSNEGYGIRTIALSGGVFQNKALYEQVIARLRENGYQVLTHHRLPANDGGLSYGQAVIAAARDIVSAEKR